MSFESASEDLLDFIVKLMLFVRLSELHVQINLVSAHKPADLLPFGSFIIYKPLRAVFAMEPRINPVQPPKMTIYQDTHQLETYWYYYNGKPTPTMTWMTKQT